MLPEPIRPMVQFLSGELCDRILEEARDVLVRVGVEIHDEGITRLVLEAGAARIGGSGRIAFPGKLLDAALAAVPRSFALHDRNGNVRAVLGDGTTHFTPGSAALNVVDPGGALRRARTEDYVRYARVVDRLDAIDYQSTALVPADVHERISDAWRLYLSLVCGASPVVTGAFTAGGLAVMAELLVAVRGDAAALARKPLAIFSCCPTAPLQWSEATARNVADCARLGIPVEIVSMPLTGFVAPGTIVGSLVQHAAETLSGVAISWASAPGAPLLWGGSPAIFDYRYETTPCGAVETMMIDAAYAQVGRRAGLPTQAYTALSDAKRLDAQCGLEAGAGALLAVLAGIDSVSGPGMLDFESCLSLEKLILDNEICRMAKRAGAGIVPREGDFPAAPHFEALLRDGHALIADHTRRWFRKEVAFPGPAIDRANRARWAEEGSRTIEERIGRELDAILTLPPDTIDAERRARLDGVIARAARAVGQEALPPHGL